MAEQIRGLAPEGAVGYRLVLPTRNVDEVPRLSPPLDATGYQGHYSLSPFQAPYDIRLMDGQTYRVVWTGVSGEVIPPKPNGTIPGLHFFLTSSARQWELKQRHPHAIPLQLMERSRSTQNRELLRPTQKRIKSASGHLSLMPGRARTT